MEHEQKDGIILTMQDGSRQGFTRASFPPLCDLRGYIRTKEGEEIMVKVTADTGSEVNGIGREAWQYYKSILDYELIHGEASTIVYGNNTCQDAENFLVKVKNLRFAKGASYSLEIFMEILPGAYDFILSWMTFVGLKIQVRYRKDHPLLYFAPPLGHRLKFFPKTAGQLVMAENRQVESVGVTCCLVKIKGLNIDQLKVRDRENWLLQVKDISNSRIKCVRDRPGEVNKPDTKSGAFQAMVEMKEPMRLKKGDPICDIRMFTPDEMIPNQLPPPLLPDTKSILKKMSATPGARQKVFRKKL